MISIFQIFRSLGLTFFIVLEAINHISICFNVLCDYMGHQMYVLFLDGGPLMVVQSYEEDDLKKKKIIIIIIIIIKTGLLL